MKLKEYFKEIYPHIWKHYEFLYERRTEINKKFDFTLAFEALLILFFIQLFKDSIFSGKLLFLIPLIFFFISLIMTFSNIILTRIWFPWFEKKDIKEIWDNKKDFYEEGLRSIYGVSHHLWEYNKRKDKLLFENIRMIFISISLSFCVIFIYNKLFITFFLFIPIYILSWKLIKKNWKRELVPKNIAKEVNKFFDEWKNEQN